MMGYELRMKIGFFETKTYDLLVHKGKKIICEFRGGK